MAHGGDQETARERMLRQRKEGMASERDAMLRGQPQSQHSDAFAESSCVAPDSHPATAPALSRGG